MIALVWNSLAGSMPGVSLDDVERRLGEVTVYELGEGRDAVRCAREALAAGASLVIAAGGDGTVSGVASALVGTDAALGVLPLGTSNSFAAALGIPGDVEGALELLAAGRERRVIDVAVVRNATERRIMTLHCMIGFHADTIAETSTDAKRRWGVLAYVGSAVKKLAGLESFAVELVTAEHVVRCKAIAVGAANLAPPKSVLAHGPSHLLGDDGRVDVTIVFAETMAEAIATGVHLYRSAKENEPATRDNVGSLSASRLAITADPPQHVLVDGEPFGETPVSIETLPRALTVIAPAPAEVLDGPPVDAPLAGLPDLEVEPR